MHRLSTPSVWKIPARRVLASRPEPSGRQADLARGEGHASAADAQHAPQPASPHQVYIVEDHPVVREGYALLFSLAPDLNVAGMAVSGEEALATLPTPAPDLVIVDMALPGMSGLDLIEALRARIPTLRVLVVSGQARQVYEARVLAAGAVGFVSKDDGPEALLAAVHTALGGPAPA